MGTLMPSFIVHRFDGKITPIGVRISKKRLNTNVEDLLGPGLEGLLLAT